MRPNVGGIGLTMMWSTHDMIFMVFGKIGILYIFTELPRNASMRPKLNAIGLYMTWGTHDSIFMVFGNIVILTPKMLVATERDILAEFWRYHRDQRVKYPLWRDCEGIWWKFFADRHTHRQTHRQKDYFGRSRLARQDFFLNKWIKSFKWFLQHEKKNRWLAQYETFIKFIAFFKKGTFFKIIKFFKKKKNQNLWIFTIFFNIIFRICEFFWYFYIFLIFFHVEETI